jgi:hypothetical protein
VTLVVAGGKPVAADAPLPIVWPVRHGSTATVVAVRTLYYLGKSSDPRVWTCFSAPAATASRSTRHAPTARSSQQGSPSPALPLA